MWVCGCVGVCVCVGGGGLSTKTRRFHMHMYDVCYLFMKFGGPPKAGRGGEGSWICS